MINDHIQLLKAIVDTARAFFPRSVRNGSGVPFLLCGIPTYGEISLSLALDSVESSLSGRWHVKRLEEVRENFGQSQIRPDL
jgi:hypothetical protein